MRRELSSCQRLRVWFISLRIPSSSYNIQQISQYLCTHSMDFFITNWSATLHSNQWVRSPCIEKQAKNPPFHLTLGAYVPLENFCKWNPDRVLHCAEYVWPISDLTRLSREQWQLCKEKQSSGWPCWWGRRWQNFKGSMHYYSNKEWDLWTLNSMYCSLYYNTLSYFVICFISQEHSEDVAGVFQCIWRYVTLNETVEAILWC